MKKQVLILATVLAFSAGIAHADNTMPTAGSTGAQPTAMAPAAMAPSAMAPSAAMPATTTASAAGGTAGASMGGAKGSAATTTSTAGLGSSTQTQATMSAQNMKMKDCATQYHAKGIAKSQYKSFMSQCLKGSSTGVTPASAAASTKSTMPTTGAGASKSNQ